MPQLDVTTYLGQVTWFFVVFSAFYVMMVSDVLPLLNRAVKLRAKKLDTQRGALRQFDGVRGSGEEHYDGSQRRSSKKMQARMVLDRSALAHSDTAQRGSRVTGLMSRSLPSASSAHLSSVLNASKKRVVKASLKAKKK